MYKTKLIPTAPSIGLMLHLEKHSAVGFRESFKPARAGCTAYLYLDISSTSAAEFLQSNDSITDQQFDAKLRFAPTEL
jgi:hypothetical protein